MSRFLAISGRLTPLTGMDMSALLLPEVVLEIDGVSHVWGLTRQFAKHSE